MNSKTKILIRVLVVGVIFLSGLFILEQITTEPIEKSTDGGEIADGLQLTIEPVNAKIEEQGVYIFQKNEPFKIKVTLKNTGDKDLNLLTPSMQNDYEKVFYFQILDMNGIIIETDTRQIIMSHRATSGPEKIKLSPGETHSFFAYINSNKYGIEHHHFDNNLVRKFPDIGFDERYYKIKGIYNTTGYKDFFPDLYSDIHEIVLYSNDIRVQIIN